MTSVIAIDGPSAAGKTTAARAVAAVLQCDVLDTGAMYRAAAWVASRNGWRPENSQSCDMFLENFSVDLDSSGAVHVDGTDISHAVRMPEISEMASAISADLQVRERLQKMQRDWADRRNMCVAEGRDMGTNVFPQAQFKFYLTASLQIRATRRALETGRSIEEEMRSLSERDLNDMTRQHSPLRKAYDAEEIDSTSLTVNQVAEKILWQVRSVQMFN